MQIECINVPDQPKPNLHMLACKLSKQLMMSNNLLLWSWYIIISQSLGNVLLIMMLCTDCHKWPGIGLCLLKSVPVFLRTLVPSQKLLLLLSNTPCAFLLGNETSLFGLFSPLLFFLFSPRANCSDCRGSYSGHFVWRAEDAERTPYLTWSEAFQESHREQHK